MNPVTTPTNATPQTLSGIKDVDSSIWLSVNVGAAYEIVALDTATTWNYNLALVSGNNFVSLTSKDALSNESLPVTSMIVYDTTAPAAPGLNSVTTPTNITSQTLTGSKEANTSIWISLNGGTVYEAAIWSTGTTWNAIISLASGTNTLSITARDAADNPSTPTPGTIEFDNNAPTDPTLNTVTTPTNTATQTLTGNKEADTSIWISVNGGGASEALALTVGTTWTVSNFALSEGTNNLSISSKDAAGNASGAVTGGIVLDTGVPAKVIISQPAASSYTDGSDSIVISGTCEIGTTVDLTGDDVQNLSCSVGTYSFTINKLVDLTYNFTLTQTDTAGNTSTPATQQWIRQRPAVTVNPTTMTMTEGGASQTFDVSLNQVPDGNVIISVVSADTTEVTVNMPTLTYTTGTWNTPQTVTVSSVADGISDGNQVVTIGITVSGATADTTGYASLNPSDIIVTNIDAGAPGFTVIPVSGLVVDETGITDTFSVVLNQLPTGNVVIDVTSLDTSEISVNTTLTFTTANWDTFQVVTVTGVDDIIADGGLVVTVQLAMNGGTADGNYLALNPPDVTVTNLDDDAVGITLNPATTLTTNEGGLTATFDVLLNTQPDFDVVLNITSVDTTEVTVDLASLTFTFGNWSSPQTVTVTGIDDAQADGNQTVTVSLTTDVSTADTTGYAALNPPDVSVTNNDNDVAAVTVTPTTGLFTDENGGVATFTVVLNTAPDGDVEINLVSNDGSEVSLDKSLLTFSTLDWSTFQTVTLTGLTDGIVDGNQTTVIGVTVNTDPLVTTDTTGYIALNPSDVSIVNMDVDVVGVTLNPSTGLITTENGGTTSFTVRLNTVPDGDVVIVIVSGNTGEITVDKGSLTFTAADWSTPQTVTLTGIADGQADGNQSVIISLVTDTLLTQDNTGYVGVNPPDATVTNVDNTVFVTVSPTSGLTTTEAGGTATFSVFLNTAPNGDVIVDLLSGTPTEVAVDKASLIFTNADYMTPQVVTLTGLDDLLLDGDQPVTIVLTMNVGTTDTTGYFNLNPPDVSVTNQDDDSKSITVSPASGLTTTESAGSTSFSVSLSSAPNGDVVIDVASGNTNEVTVDKATLTFTMADYQTSQTVTLTGVNDTTADGDIGVTITLVINAGSTTDTSGYDTPTIIPSVAVTNLDNETTDTGTQAVPEDVTVALPLDGSVGSATSYYIVTGLTNGIQYNVSVSSVSEDLSLFVYDDTSYSNLLCSRDKFGDARPEACLATVTATGQVVVEVNIITGTSGGTYTVDVTPAPISTGAAGAPVDITASMPDYLGGIAGAAPTNSYYVVTGLAASTLYRVEATNLTDDIDLEVFSDLNFTVSECATGVSSIAETCEATSNASGELYIQVFDGGNYNTEAAFYLNVLDPLIDEGSQGSPVNLTGQLPYSGMIKTTASYYILTGLIPNATYTVELINMAGQGALDVFSDAIFATSICGGGSDAGGNWPESCAVTANGSGILYIQGLPGGGFSTAGATYSIQIK